MKKTLFFENAELLFRKFGIVPLMYGSLGLEYITDESLNSDDIDILIPEVFINQQWKEFTNFLSEEGYSLIDEHEHTFVKNGVLFSYSSVEELEAFAGIKLDDIETFCDNGIRFMVLSLQQYLQVYRASVKDGYRINTRKKKDKDKITFIENLI